jgi:hypothetical protein
MIARFLKAYSRRRWLYAAGEMLSLSIGAICLWAVCTGKRFQLTPDDAGIAPFTAGVLAILSIIVWIVIVIMREQDAKT